MKTKTGDKARADRQQVEPTGVPAGKYELLGEGSPCAAGVSFRGRHALLDAPVSVTVLTGELTQGPERQARLQERVRCAAGLRHDHIVPVVDLGMEAGRYHVVEAFVDAPPLARLLRETGALPPADALHIVRQLADALAHAHERGVVHGALTPDSILVEQGAPPRVLLAGFGTEALPWQGTSAPASLLPYGAPERAGSADIDGRVDIFALGLVLFEMLAGKPVFSGSEQEVREQLFAGTGPLLPRFSHIAPAGVPALVARTLRRQPAERHPGMADLRAEVDTCLRRLGQASPQTPSIDPVPADPRPRRCVMVVDDTVAEDADDAAPADETPTTATGAAAAKRRVQGAFEGIVVTVGRRRRMPAGGMIVAALVMLGLGLGWPLLRASAPAPVVTAAAAVPPVAEGTPLETAVNEPVAVATVAPADDEVAAPDPEPVRNRAPRIASRRPAGREAVRVAEAQSVELSVRATDPNPGDRLAYVWLVDGQRQKTARGPRWRFTAPYGDAGTTHTVEAEVSDPAGLKAPRASWTLAVTPRMSEVNVRDWLGRLVVAWERKDIATLRLYGVVTTDTEAAAVRKRAPWFGGYHVSIKNETIRTDGPYASVAFDRVESDGGGRVLGSARESFHLEKHPNGFVALRAR